MKVSSLANYALAITMGAALLAGCSSNGGSSLAPSGTGMSRLGHIGRVVTVDGHMQTAEHPNLGVRVVTDGSPGAKKKKPTDQNISNFSSSNVAVFECPHHKCAQIQTISGITSAQGECTNVLFGSGKKTFWVTSSTSAPGAVDEYKVGKTDKLVTTLNTPSGDIPVGCAMSTTGDLVATSIGNGKVTLFKGAKGTGTDLQTPLVEAFFPGYDKSGNLYVDGFNASFLPALVELPKGSSSWTTLSGVSIGFPGGVQFDGKYITVNDQTNHVINGYTCSAGSCTLKQTTPLTGASDCDQTWIAKKYVICPDAGNNNAAEYPYPKGGSAIHQLTGSFSTPLASSASIAESTGTRL